VAISLIEKTLQGSQPCVDGDQGRKRLRGATATERHGTPDEDGFQYGVVRDSHEKRVADLLAIRQLRRPGAPSQDRAF
jgi:hypothetical protein